jgi:hypothetical protein
VHYKGWFNVRDVPSRGNAHVYWGTKIPRQFHLLSDPEAIRFLQHERDPSVLDILDNLPIFDIDWTVDACVFLGLRHRYEDGYPAPFTLDFVVKREVEKSALYFAESIKVPEDAADEDIRLRLSVESNWCRVRPKIPYELIDTAPYFDATRSKDTHKRLLSTLEFMRAWHLLHYEPNTQRELRFERAFAKQYERNMPLEELNRNIARAMRVPVSLVSDMFRFCSWHDRIPVSLKHPLALHLPVVLRQS